MSGLLEAGRFLQAGVMCDFISQLLFLPSLNQDKLGLNVSTNFPRSSGCWMKSCSMWISAVLSRWETLWQCDFKIRPVFVGHVMFEVIKFSCLDVFSFLQMENVNLKCTIVAVLVLVRSMVPLFLKDGLLVPYVVTSLAFLFISIRLLSALERCSEAELRLGTYHKLLFCLPKLDLACIVRWKVSAMF